MFTRKAITLECNTKAFLCSLQNRQISGASAIHERTRKAQGQKYPPVITPLFMLFRPQTPYMTSQSQC